MLIRQLTEPQRLTCSGSVDSAGVPAQWTGNDLSELHWHSVGNHLGQLHSNTWVFPAFNQPTQLNIDRMLTEMMIYSGMIYFFWEWMDCQLSAGILKHFRNVREPFRIYLCANYFARAATKSFWYQNAIGRSLMEGCFHTVCCNQAFYSKGCNECNPPSIPIRDRPIAFMLRNKLVDNFAK